MMFDRKKSINLCRSCLLGSDVCAFLLAYLAGGLLFYLVREETLARLGLNFFTLMKAWSIYYLLIIPFALVRFWYVGHYTRRKPFWDELKDIVQVLGFLFIVEGTILFLIKSSFSRLWLGSAFVFVLILLPVLRIMVKRSLDAAGKWQISTVLIGTGQNAVDAISALKSEKLLGFSVQCVLSIDDQTAEKKETLTVGELEFPILPMGKDPVASIRKFGDPNVVFAMESGGIRNHLELIESLQQKFIDIYVVPALRGLPLYGMEINTFFRHEVLLLRVRNILARRMPRLLKRSFDIAGSLMLIVMLSPLLAVLFWKVRSDGGNALYAHKRVGRNGQKFDCLKFRSMVVDAEKILADMLEEDDKLRGEWIEDFKLKDDPRVTPIGAFLRRTSLDELPQLWNVLRGEMSLVGPRPIVAEEMARYGNNIHYYKSVRPGMTGLWQISGRNDTDYSNRIYLDAWYVKNWSLWSDIVIMLKTVDVVLSKRGAY
ncbi:MAG: undecaprenyl-phosphate galactose phosphotransferase WbaP [Desulfuromonadales bacterium]